MFEAIQKQAESIEERFWPKVEKGDPEECWPWQASIDADGYGRFGVDYTNTHAHRVAYMLEVGDPEDQNVLHHCDNRVCCNPAHLYAGEQSDNWQDAVDRDRLADGQVFSNGEEHPKSKLTADEVAEIKEKLSEGATQTELAEEYGVSRPTVTHIDRGNTWNHV